jgi:hypothetical protein
MAPLNHNNKNTVGEFEITISTIGSKIFIIIANDLKNSSIVRA